ncbi:MAG: nucleoside hydrolase [Promethearchaeota archaeon]
MKVLIDTDPGLGKNFADVDDGLALFLMLNNPDFFEIEGITTVFGNTQVKQGFKLLKKYLNLVGKTNIPYFLGARSKHDFGYINEASQFLIDKVKEKPNELTLLTLGPLTNIASALKNYPDFLNNLKSIITMGGVIEPINPFINNKNSIGDQFFNDTEFNFKSDPLATKTIIEAQTLTPRILMALDICCKVIFNEDHLKQIRSIDKPIQQFIAENVDFWLKLWKFSDKGGFFPFDAFVPIYLMRPNLFKTINYFFIVGENGKISITKQKKENSAPIIVCTDFAEYNGRKEFMDILISNLTKTF